MVQVERKPQPMGSAGVSEQEQLLPNGPAAAAILAAGIGSTTLGLLAVLAEASARAASLLNLYNPVGPLSGKTLGAVAVWLVSWLVLHTIWRNRDVRFGPVFVASLALIAVGFLGTFPPFFTIFAAE